MIYLFTDAFLLKACSLAPYLTVTHFYVVSPNPPAPLFSWNVSTPPPLDPRRPFIDSLGNLVIRLDSNPDTNPDTNRSWSGEYLCLYTCDEDGVGETFSGSVFPSSSSSSSSSSTPWKRRILWLTVYERDPVAAADLRTLFFCVGILAAVVIAVAVTHNAEEIKFAIWRCLRADRGPFSYIV